MSKYIQETHTKQISRLVFLFGVSTIFTVLCFFTVFTPLYFVVLVFFVSGFFQRAENCALAAGYWTIVFFIGSFTFFNHSDSITGAAILILVPLVIVCLCIFKFGNFITYTGLLFIPILPGHPLVVSAGLLDGYGFFGLGIILIFIGLIERSSKQVKTLLCLIALTLSIHSKSNNFEASTTFKKVEISYDKYLGQRENWNNVFSKIPNNSVVVIGENSLKTTDGKISNWICLEAARKNAIIFTGVFNVATQRPEVWKYEPYCIPKSVYKAVVRAPFDFSQIDYSVATQKYEGEYSWLICFEAFLITRWVAELLNSPKNIIIISNDFWSQPLNITLLREKIVKGFSQAFGFNYGLAETWAGILIKSEK